MVTKLRKRGVQDIFIACVDGLKGSSEAIEAVFPRGFPAVHFASRCQTLNHSHSIVAGGFPEMS